jgi:glucan phosphoethanolaminetransferase (alkaline phosphatase superfamily)
MRMRKFPLKEHFFAPRVGRIKSLSLTSTGVSLIVLCLIIDKSYRLSTISFAITTILIGIAVVNLFFLNVRRLNDVGMSGIWTFVYLLPLGPILYIATFFMKGNLTSNKYGEQPIKPILWDYFLMAFGPVILFFVLPLLSSYLSN